MHFVLVALLLSAADAATVDAGTSPATALRQQATDAFRAKRYAEACPLFAQASAADPKNGEIFADLGLCWDKAGEKAKAQEATLQAATLGDATTRLHAYFNLGKLGRTLDANQPKDPGCRVWNSDVECAPSRTLTACAFSTSGGGTGSTDSSSGTAICPKESDASSYSSDDPNKSCSAYIDDVEHQDLCGATSNHFPGCDDDSDSKECQAAIAECEKTASTEQKASCVPVFLDACLFRVGVVCNGKAFELTAGHGFDASSDLPPAPVKKPAKKKRK